MSLSTVSLIRVSNLFNFRYVIDWDPVVEANDATILGTIDLSGTITGLSGKTFIMTIGDVASVRGITDLSAGHTFTAGVDDTFKVTIDTGSEITVTFSGTRTLTQIVSDINAVTGLANVASTDGNFLRLTSNGTGTSTSVTIGNGNANIILGFTVGQIVQNTHTVTFTTETILSQIVSTINNTTGLAGVASVDGNFLRLTSNETSTSRSIVVGNGTANGTLGFANGVTSTGIDGYKIYRSRSYYDGFSLTTTVPKSVTQYVNAVPTNWNVNWYYKVTAYRSGEESSLTDTTAVSDFTIDVFTEQPFPVNVISTDFVTGETPVGAINGTNKTFYTQSAYRPGTLQVYLSGQLIKRSIDYNEVGGTSFVLIEAPVSRDYLTVSYIKLV